MKKLLLLVLLIVFSTPTFSQKRSELLAQIKDLNEEIRHLNEEISKAKREISSSNAKADTLEDENNTLRAANATLLTNLGSFSELSKKNSENVNKTLAALERKEKQLNDINTMIAVNDSILIASLTQIRKQLGEGVQVDVVGGAIVIANTLTPLFGSDTSSQITGAGKTWLTHVAKVLLAYPHFAPQVEGLNITGDFEVTFDQALAIAKELTANLKLPVDHLTIAVKDGNFKEGMRIKLHPDYKAFYNTAKANSKGS